MRLADLDKLSSFRPVAEYSQNPDVDVRKLALEPMTMADMLDAFARLTAPREELGEGVASYEADILSTWSPDYLKCSRLSRTVQAKVLWTRSTSRLSPSFAKVWELSRVPDSSGAAIG